jgi:hypothetical protein
MRTTIDSFYPMLRCKGACVDHATNHLFQGPIFSLCHTVLLRCIGENMLNIYPFKSEKLFKAVVHIFSFSFPLKKVDPGVSIKVINKSDQVASLSERQGWKWTCHIIVNQLKDL